MFQTTYRTVALAAVMLVAGTVAAGNPDTAQHNGAATTNPGSQVTVIAGVDRSVVQIRSTRFR